MRSVHDLVYFGNFTFSDVGKMVVVEREKMYEFTKERKKEHDESIGGLLGSIFGIKK